MRQHKRSNEVLHSAVAVNGKVVFDPHPDATGLVNEVTCGVFLSLEPWRITTLERELAEAKAREANLLADSKRLDWMQFNCARVVWGKGGEYCFVEWYGEEDIYRTELHADWRAAIDFALQQKGDTNADV